MKEETLNDNSADIICDGIRASCSYYVTPRLRYAKKQIMVGEQACKYELMLQQMWQGMDGSQKWEWVEVVE